MSTTDSARPGPGRPGLGRPGPWGDVVHRRWPAQPRQLPLIRGAVRRWLAPLPLTNGARGDLLLAVGEAARNGIEHAYPPAAAYGTVELTFWTDAHSVHIEVADHGSWRTPLARPIGVGIPRMRRLVESVTIHHDARGTRVLLSHRLSAGACAPPPRGHPPPASLPEHTTPNPS